MIFVYHQREFLLLVLQSFLCGVLLGGIYDMFRISRLLAGITPLSGKSGDALYEKEYPVIGRLSQRAVKAKKLYAVILFFEDILFMLIAAGILLVLLFFRNDGKFRLIVPVLSLFGFFCYYISIGRLVIYFSSYIVLFLRLITAYSIHFLLLPFKLAQKLLKKCAYILINRIRNIYIGKNIIKKSQKYKTQLQNEARAGFFVLQNDAVSEVNKKDISKKIGGRKNAKGKA